MAVDNILERVVSVKNDKIACVRLGHPTRINENVLSHCLDAVIMKDDATEIVNDIKSELKELRKSLDSSKKQSKAARWAMFSEIKALQSDLRKREKMVVQGILKKINVRKCVCVILIQILLVYIFA